MFARAVGGPVRVRSRALMVAAALSLSAGAAAAQDAPPASVEQLRDLSIDQLANLQVTSVARSPQSLSDAPAAIYVITHDQIVRSGLKSLPEILRLAPNLFVARTSGDSWVIAARGLDGNDQDQAFSNKLLVMIDGRSVYTPLFSGVYWDMQGVLAEDIDRIEVISGPGATLWGANAYSGVINIITRSSGDTQGVYAEGGGGNGGARGAVRYGGRLGEHATWRVYAEAAGHFDSETATGATAHDHWERPQGGFRLDWSPSQADAVTMQGDAYYGSEVATSSIGGGDVLARWSHAWDSRSSLQVQAYFDRIVRGDDSTGGSGFWQNMYDLDVQDSLALGSRHALVFGGGVRVSQYSIVGTPTLQFAPARADLHLADAFVQDTVTLARQLKLTLGLKIEDDPYSGASALPDVRLSFTPAQGVLLWAAASQAVRSPTPFDTDVVEKVGSEVFLTGDHAFEPERLTAYQAGLRLQPVPSLSLSVSAYDNVYQDLRSVEATPVTFVPIHWGNGMQGYAYGLEAWADYQVAAWWRLGASLNLLSEHLKFRPGDLGLLGVAQAGDDPKRQASLKSTIDLGGHVSWFADLRYVSALPDPHVPSYVELDTSVGWDVTRHIRLALSGFNLLHERHVEFATAAGGAVSRSVYAELQFRY